MQNEEERFVHVMLMLDTNCINARGADADLNQIERWQADGVVHVIMSVHSSSEARAGRNALRSAKALDYVYSYVGAGIDDEYSTKESIGNVLFPAGARTDAERNDIEIVFHALKYQAILVTNDGDSKRQPGGILGHRDMLARLGVTVMRPGEVVADVRDKIEARDQRARHSAEWQGNRVPSWVGQD
jgi:hypothetical protein